MIRIIFGWRALCTAAFEYPGKASDANPSPTVFKKSRLVWLGLFNFYLSFVPNVLVHKQAYLILSESLSGNSGKAA
jgi:hypothetical protein